MKPEKPSKTPTLDRLFPKRKPVKPKEGEHVVLATTIYAYAKDGSLRRVSERGKGARPRKGGEHD